MTCLWDVLNGNKYAKNELNTLILKGSIVPIWRWIPPDKRQNVGKIMLDSLGLLFPRIWSLPRLLFCFKAFNYNCLSKKKKKITIKHWCKTHLISYRQRKNAVIQYAQERNCKKSCLCRENPYPFLFTGIYCSSIKIVLQKQFLQH